ncbi:unnamed protein product [Rangifer tarandus platyrhynchus]|uniref:Uncharacterized protein n=2 Tax=Rangifer tarandus platyrhynchus TaxID=3082113 RepID=A0ABN8ZPV7_RANTA|nr:unnamed protein product [Rangifer tarandus platyrhynchus]CAI9709638.1 unnamed protein product [Rangifer tarandus platyrhynchus]
MLTGPASASSFGSGSDSGTDLGSGSGSPKPGHLFSTLREGTTHRQATGLQRLNVGWAFCCLGSICKTAASSQGSLPAGLASSMREYFRAAALSDCPGPASAFQVARRGPLCRPLIEASLLKYMFSRCSPSTTPSPRLLPPSFLLYTFPFLRSLIEQGPAALTSSG